MNTKRYILRDSSVRAVLKTHLDFLVINDENPTMEVIIRPHKKNRTLAQNCLMWDWLTQIAVFLDREHGVKTIPRYLKEEFQERFLGYRSYVKTDGTIGRKLVGTSEITVKPFTEFLNNIEVYARSELGVNLTHPEDYYYEAMGK